jgi:hypothetical protein
MLAAIGRAYLQLPAVGASPRRPVRPQRERLRIIIRVGE